MRAIPTTTSTTIAPIATTSSLTTSPSQHSLTWHSLVPYLFGGLAVMLGLMYVWFSRSTQHSVEVHSVEWCMAKEAARSMMVMQWSRDLGMA
ncbi:hypothetical protein GYH30_042822 [Glycine max]|nr:hypothetical protein GYH30_042822 [Glycine max]